MATDRPDAPDPDDIAESTAGHAPDGDYSIEGHTTDSGFVAVYTAPEGRDPYDTWDWVAVYDGSSMPGWDNLDNYINWQWVCPDESCGNVGATLIPNAAHQSGSEYTLAYFLDNDWSYAATTTITAPE